MRTLTEWLGEYGESHQNATNKLLHWICVPPIVLSVLGLLWSIPVPQSFAALSPWLNWATISVVLALVYYLVLSPALTLGIALGFGVMLFIVQSLDTLPWPLWATSIAIFVVGWIGQFIGHAVEKKRPSFFKDMQFLLIGPLWLIAALYRWLGIRY
jgi:uncharacterized membrane protein YGL010W